MNKEYKIPKSWTVVVLGQFCDKVSLNNIKIKEKEYLQSGRFPVVDQGQKLIGGYFNNEKLLVPGDPPFIIFGDHTKVIKFINFKFIAGADGVIVLKPYVLFDAKFFFYLIHVVELPNKGYARHFQFLEKKEICLPPLNEQHRIVAKIEELFSSLNKGIESLKTAQQQLKIYRQAVLKYAFEGKLTNKIVNGELPQNWRKVKLSSVTEKVERVKLKERNPEEEFIYIDIGSIDNNLNKIIGYKIYKWKKAPSRAQQIIKSEDTLFSTVRTYLRNNALVDKSIYNNNICSSGFTVIRANQERVIPKYLFYQSIYEGFIQSLNKLQTGTSYPAVRDEDVFNQFLNVPKSKSEQKLIVKEIESRLSVCDKIEENINQSLEQAEALRQSILKKAFEGKLAPQDLNDEPAAKLLERIKAERERKVLVKKSITKNKNKFAKK